MLQISKILLSSSFHDKTVSIPDSCQIIFVSDLFIQDYVGGAELSAESLIKSSPFSVFKLHSKHVTRDLIEQRKKSIWIFGNFAMLNITLLPYIILELDYVIIESDYKYCRYRCPELHFKKEQRLCNCNTETYGKLISAFFYGARSIFWRSEKQMEIYHEKFPFLAEKSNAVQSAVFDKEILSLIRDLSERHKDIQRRGWIVLGSNSWVKGFENAKAWCEEKNIDYEVVWGLTHKELLSKLSISEGFVYLPNGEDTCPRMVIEAKLLDCELHLNDFVQHKDEKWFVKDDIAQIESHLQRLVDKFWEKMGEYAEYNRNITGYPNERMLFDACLVFKRAGLDDLYEIGLSDLKKMTPNDPEILLELGVKANDVKVAEGYLDLALRTVQNTDIERTVKIADSILKHLDIDISYTLESLEDIAAVYLLISKKFSERGDDVLADRSEKVARMLV